MTEAPTTVPWDDSEDVQWTADVDGWPWRSLGGGDWGKTGKCPRCRATMTIRLVTTVFAKITDQDVDHELFILAERGPIERDREGERHLFVRCNCSRAHDGRPTDLTGGCGSWGYISLPPESDE